MNINLNEILSSAADMGRNFLFGSTNPVQDSYNPFSSENNHNEFGEEKIRSKERNPIYANYANVAAEAGNALKRDFSHFSKFDMDPLYGKKEEIIDKLYVKLNKRSQALNAKNPKREISLRKFWNKKEELNKEIWKKYLPILDQDSNGLPKAVQDAIVQLQIYDDIPVKDGIIYGSLSKVPFYEKNKNGDTSPFWYKGVLKPMNGSALISYMVTRFNMSKADLKKLPSFQILRAYLRNKNFTKAYDLIKKRALKSIDPEAVAKKMMRFIKKTKGSEFSTLNSQFKPDLSQFSKSEKENIKFKSKVMDSFVDGKRNHINIGRITNMIDDLGGVPASKKASLTEVLGQIPISSQTLKNNYSKYVRDYKQ